MRRGSDRARLRGILVLAVAGLVGIGLAVHGYGRGVVVATGPGGVGAPAAAGAHAQASAPTPATSSSSNGTSSASNGTPASSTAPAQKLGPLLSSTQYAPFAYELYPSASGQARQVTAGFAIQVVPQGGTIKVSVSVPGGGQGPQTSDFPAGDRVYFIEATLGDDSGGADYSFGDDAVIVTNAKGYVVQ